MRFIIELANGIQDFSRIENFLTHSLCSLEFSLFEIDGKYRSGTNNQNRKGYQSLSLAQNDNSILVKKIYIM